MNNLKLMRKRLEFQGGIAQEDRMIKDKYRTFLKTLKYSYQGCDVIMAQKYDTCLNADPLENDDAMMTFPRYRALINPDKLKQDYDNKILSIDYNYDYCSGDVFQWVGTSTYWIIYLQELTEDSYFRGEIRRCSYQIKFRDNDGNFLATWASIRGPVETQIDSIQKNQIRLDRPNLSLNILLPQNEKTLQAFERYKEFIFAGRCWRVEAHDTISIKNIIEVNAEEYFIDKDTDNDIKNGLIIDPVDLTPDSEIEGPTFIKPQISEVYYSPEPGGKWCILENAPIKLVPKGVNEVEVIWNKMTSGQFTLRWSKKDKKTEKTIVVESLF